MTLNDSPPGHELSDLQHYPVLLAPIRAHLGEPFPQRFELNKLIYWGIENEVESGKVFKILFLFVLFGIPSVP